MQPSEKVIKRGEDFAYLTPLIKGEHSKGLKIQVEESCKTSYEWTRLLSNENCKTLESQVGWDPLIIQKFHTKKWHCYGFCDNKSSIGDTIFLQSWDIRI